MNSNQLFTPINPLWYIGVWVALLVAMVILYRVRRDAAFRIRWHARIALFISVIIGTGMILITGSPVVLLMVVIGGGVITYLNITNTTICKQCGRIVQPVRLLNRASHCPHCGGETARSRLVA